MLVKSEGAIKNGFFRDTGNIGHTRHMTNKLKRKPSIMDTPETLATLSTQNKRQKKELVKTKGAIKNGHSRDTGCIGHTKHRNNTLKRKPMGRSIMDTSEILATMGTQDTGQIN